jgi:acyl-CoA thioester hydrolase
VSADGKTVHAEGRRVNIKLDPATLRPAPWTSEGRATGSLLLRT